MARAFGGHGEVVERTEDFPAAFERCRAAPTFGLLHLKVDPEAITPKWSLSQIRAGALSPSG
jgi:acetolactate synthase-1/2/3 large subunit